jgi:hypothetical protein
MTDYAAMTNEQLNVEIAKRRGYRFAWHTVEGGWFGESGFEQIFDPQGHWLTAIDAELPEWATDMNDALELIIDIDWQMAHYTTGYHVHLHGTWIDEWEGKNSFSTHVAADTMARAICECWLKWLDVQVEGASQ